MERLKYPKVTRLLVCSLCNRALVPQDAGCPKCRRKDRRWGWALMALAALCGFGFGAMTALGVLLAPILHPQSILRGQWALEPAQVQFLKRAWDIAKSAVPPELPDVRQAPTNCNPVPSINDLAQFVWDTQSNDVLACDIEGTQGRLIGIGFCRLRDEVGIYVPFLNGEVTYWSDTQWPIAENMVRALLTRPLVFHNGQAFDIPFLESCGYEVPRYHDDTMIRHHILYAEMPKSLEELAVL